jgi:hypothetical protein
MTEADFLASFPLDFSMTDERGERIGPRLESELIRLVPTNAALQAIAEEICPGVSPLIAWDGPVRYTWRDVLKRAAVGGFVARIVARAREGRQALDMDRWCADAAAFRAKAALHA